MTRWSLSTSAIAAFVALAIAPSAFATESPKDPEPEAVEAPVITDERGREDYEDVQELQKLERESFEPVVLGSGAFDADVLAPTTGILGQIQRDAGRVPEVLTERRRSGSQLLAVPAVRERFASTPMLGLSVHDQPSVRKYIDFFDGRGKPILAKWIERMGRYQPLISQVLEEEGLPQDLIFVAMIESGFSPYATSPAAAAGVWQFIATTGSEMGLRIDPWVDERRDPVRATRAAAKYLKHLHDKFGSWPLALAAYNGGPGLMAKEIGKHNSNSYWRIQREHGMYRETRRYVPKIIAAGLVTKNADIFNLHHVEPVQAERWTEVEVPERTRLGLVADACGVDFDVIEDLNPGLVRKQTPPGDDWNVRIPQNKLARFVEKFDGYVARQGAEHESHTVAFGESLRDIGEKYGIRPRVIRVANGLEKRERASFGEELVIPTKAMGSWKAKTRKRTVVIANAKLEMPGHRKFFYEAKDGDTPDVVARGFGLNAADVVMWNKLDPNAKLQDSMVIQLFFAHGYEPDSLALRSTELIAAVEPDSSTARRIARQKQTTRRKYHRVRNGESLWLIARKYKVTVGNLKKWNRKLRRSNLLQPGMKLVVYPGRK